MSALARNYTVDIFRLIGAFSVILIHTIKSGNSVAHFALQTMHWAVAFFFMASGYFFNLQYQRVGFEAFKKTLLNLVGIFIVANIIFALFNLGKGTLHSVLSVYGLVMYGFSFHLWFINAMIGSYVLLWILLKFNLLKLIIPVALVLLVYNLVTQAYPFVFNVHFKLFASHSIGFPLIVLGYYIAQYQDKLKLTMGLGIGIAVTGYLLQFGEIELLQSYSSKLLGYHLGLGTRIYALGLFICAIAYAGVPGNLSTYGRKYSLAIYLYHPIIFSSLYWLGKKYLDPESLGFIIIFPLVSIVASFSVIYVLDKWLTPVFKIINGSIGLEHMFKMKQKATA